MNGTEVDGSSSKVLTALPAIDFAARRRALIGLLGDGTLALMAQPRAVRNGTVEHHYRPESFLFYLTGLAEPDCALIVAASRAPGDQTHLFLRGQDSVHPHWHRRAALETAAHRFGVDRAHPIAELGERLPELLHGSDALHYSLGNSEEHDRLVVNALNCHRKASGLRGVDARLPVFDAQRLAGRLRLRKRPEEVARMRAAVEISRRAYATVLRTLRPGQSEHAVHYQLLSEFARHGAESESYRSVVAGGARACVLFYAENDGVLDDGDLVMVDAGAQVDYYCSDITRTFPVGRTFSAPQREIYERVLRVQGALLDRARSGHSLAALQDEAFALVADVLVDFGWLRASRDEILETGRFKRYCPHGVSHWVGMDVHDVGAYWDGDEPLRLEPGMTFTVEPGFYVQPDDDDAPPEFRGIGVRIEDIVLIGERGTEVLTAAIPKAIAELENRY